MRHDIDIFYYIDIYKRHLKRIVLLAITAMLITAMIQSMRPVTYRSTLIAVSSKNTAQSGNFEKLFGLSMSTSSDDIIYSMLTSRRMRSDIERHFKLKNRPRSWWKLATYVVIGGFAIEVTGSDPKFTRDIANFAAKNVDEINKELKVTTDLGMVKVLDPALIGKPIRQVVFKKVLGSGLFVFFAYTLFIFFGEYFSQLKRTRKQ